MPLILPGNVASATAGAYEVANSCRFNSADNAYMGKTSGGDGTATSGTFSCWVKRGNLGVTSSIMSQVEDGSNFMILRFTSGDALDLRWRDTGSGTDANLTTTQLFRDPSAWMNIVVKFLTSDGTGSNRVKIYINGTQVTSFSSSDYPTENDALFGNVTSGVFRIGDNGFAASGEDFDGYIAEVVWLDNTSTTASDFGEFNEDSPTIWQPKDVSGLTFGTNGFYLDFEASDNLGNDANGGTDLTEVNLAAADQATDSPTNNFCTLNPLGNYIGNFSEANQSALVFREGNNFAGKATHGTYLSTMATDKMKFYFEMKPTDTNTYMGIIDISTISTSVTHSYEDATANSYYPYGNRVWVAGSNSAAGGFDNTQNQIYMFAVDPANNKMWYGRGGTWVGDPAAGSSETWDSLPANTLWTPWVNPNATTQENDTACNFGGCSAFDISSANQDANGYGNFEYAVPSGFLALCTKNLGSDGG